MKKTASKFFKNLFCSTLLWSVFTIFSVTTLSSCLNDDDVPIPDVPFSYISIYHLSPNTLPLNIQVNSSRINSLPFEYEDYSGYVRLRAGQNAFKFTPTNASNTVVDTTFSMGRDSLYSLFIIADSNTVETLVTLDKINLRNAENSLVRVLNASPDTPELRLVFTNNSIAEKVYEYSEVSDFAEVASGRFTFEVQNAETNEVLATVTNVDFLSQRVYSILIKGYSKPASNNLNEFKVEVVPAYYN